MPTAIMRLNFIQPGLEPKEMSARYKAGLDMAEFADQHGFMAVTHEEHHGADNGWSPSPLVTAGAVFGRTRNVAVSVSALLVPLHDPLRIAEDIAVLDLLSGGRLSVIGGIGYRPQEYAAHGKDWASRGALMDEAVATMLKAWTGEPFEYRGTTVRVTPKPVSSPMPFMLGGTSKPAVRRAVRFGLPIFFAAPVPDLMAMYYELCEKEGKQGFAMMPENFAHHWIADDPDKAWAEVGKYLFHEAKTYADWQTPDIKSAVHSHANSAEELRAEGIYRIVTPDEIVAEAKAAGDGFSFNFHPLCGGMPIDRGWEFLQIYVDKVLPQLA
ncbi:MAG TPA: LLM class flavin-dependent oxidoreductase [Acidimicrobiales bacterium]|jgi:alkanesulfonate monooxygenase SsuD/methylene tetrahydromethanopterin reductase-like flavin-dependent oxidoreductase (luciferase family)|nr:LLM class flavin-dependent oxidoreductase [Acidimicrobiales bacterium]